MSEVDILLALVTLVGVFGAYEMFGVDERFRHVHTISYFAQRHRWLAVLIGILFVLGGGFGLGWWVRHITGAVITK